MELGAGVGVCGIIVASYLASDVTMSDCDSEILDLISRNIDRNIANMSVRPKVKRLDWNDEGDSEKFDVIIASDCIFKSTAAPFLSAIYRHLNADGELFLINPPETCRPGVDGVIYALQELGDVAMKVIQITMMGLYQKELILVHLTGYSAAVLDEA